jgi:hypothetical protein
MISILLAGIAFMYLPFHHIQDIFNTINIIIIFLIQVINLLLQDSVKVSTTKYIYTHTNINTHTYESLTRYPRRGSRGISDIPQRCLRFAKITYLLGIL